ncbi:hypothetical protein MDAP_002656 [Mitosporidium daphniae]|uniref:Uncharacterized protein n=1 Tax=Mitosporidium daphniae TaxID=1485682 RepID=A0A098VNH1_9MICR|nr:uncharacterized protein DI09_62p70 [Mitosporidium daphniae]KGG50603.1 hypothetical protein DI09_62p70 [Mitosporidium daphniae]|eukprot:XP_013237047.1 uncharacterized protein DI09_62p70 [Mitosporidium daphniae]
MKLNLYLTSFLATALALSSVGEAKEERLFGIETIPTYNGRTQYVYIYGPNKRSRCEAVKACKALSGGHLASIPSQHVLKYLEKFVKKSPAFIGSWEGNDYQGAAIAIYPGGAIAIANPELGDFICEVPLDGACTCSESSSTEDLETSTTWWSTTDSSEPTTCSSTSSDSTSCSTSSSTSSTSCSTSSSDSSSTTCTSSTSSSSCPFYFSSDIQESTSTCDHSSYNSCDLFAPINFSFSADSSSEPFCDMNFGYKNAGDNAIGNDDMPSPPVDNDPDSTLSTISENSSEYVPDVEEYYKTWPLYE